MTNLTGFERAKSFLSKGWDSNQCSFGDYLQVCSKLYDAYKELLYLEETSSTDKNFGDKLINLENDVNYLLMKFID